MRIVSRAALAAPLIVVLSLAASGAQAQVQQNDPNAANASLAHQGEVRALQQQRTTDFNTLNMQAQRHAQYRADAPGYGLRGARFRRGGGAGGRVRARGGLDSGICVGC